MADGTGIQSRITCPHCWKVSKPHEIKWVSAHPDLRDDSKVPDGQRRFLPTHFSLAGQAIDSRGEECSDIACPRCHLVIPRDLVELPPAFFSILGSPGSGKSYFLASAMWSLRTSLSREFRISFEDSDPVSNEKLHEYEETLFVNSKQHQLVALPKTELDGDLYEQVEIEPGRIQLLPRAFVFRLRLLPDHPQASKTRRPGRAMCLYDNAGEHFLPGAHSANTPGTRHLAVSKCLLFLFDPTQHPQFRKLCQKKTTDPQIVNELVTFRQDHILAEATKRIRSELGLAMQERDKRPLIVVLTKYDAWSRLVGDRKLKREWVVKQRDDGTGVLNLPQIQEISGRFRDVLQQIAPEIVSTSEAFSENVIYMPVSALGCAPQEIPDAEGRTMDSGNSAGRRALGIYPDQIAPVWADAPFLYAMHRTMPELIDAMRMS